MARKAIRGNVDHCPYHTREDQHGKEIRIGECVGYCRISAQLRGGFPLANFLVKLAGYTNADLVKADSDKAAKIYGINPEHSAGYIRLEIERRGLRTDGPVLGSGSRRVAAPRKRRKVAA